jgi:ubiquinone/menaquinone biosynthesis C-methylase UbiE
MAFHTYPLERADALEDVSRLRYCSREELVGALDPAPGDVVADLGSGTGFYTDEVAPFVGTCHAVDVQAGMHERYREKGAPANVRFVTAEVADLPFGDGALDGAFSTMTYHEFATPGALAELRRALTAGARFVVVDWTGEGSGDEGPPLDERFDADEAAERLADAGFDVRAARGRPETFLVVATA